MPSVLIFSNNRSGLSNKLLNHTPKASRPPPRVQVRRFVQPPGKFQTVYQGCFLLNLIRNTVTLQDNRQSEGSKVISAALAHQRGATQIVAFNPEVLFYTT